MTMTADQTDMTDTVLAALELPESIRWAVKRALGEDKFASFAEAQAALKVARAAKDAERQSDILAAMVDLANTCDDAWITSNAAGRDSLHGQRAFERAIALATKHEELSRLFNNCVRESPFEAAIFRRAAVLIRAKANKK